MKRFFGGLLLGIGILIMTTSGLCSLWVVVMTLSDLLRSNMILWLLAFGGIPFAAGYGLYALGRLMLRQARRAREEE